MRSVSLSYPILLLALAFGCSNQPTPGTPDDDSGAGGNPGGGGRGPGGGGRTGSGGGSSPSDGGSDGSGGAVVIVGPEDCGLQNAAFCEDFEDGPSPGGRGGDLDDAKFAFSRWGHVTTFFDRPGAWTVRPGELFDVQRNMPTFCGAEFSNVLIGEDARICSGAGVGNFESMQFQEVFDDAGDFGLNSIMVRQPFNFADGGVLVFDVDGKRNHYYEGHGWWFELWITEDPAPIPYHSAPTVSSFPRNGLGIQFTPVGICLSQATGDCNELGTLFVTRNYEIIHEFPGAGNFPKSGGFVARDQELNHFEVRLTKERIEIWASDAGTTEMHLVQAIDGLDLSFDTGFVHLQHSHYNAFKDARPQFNDGVWASPAQVYRWDNIGFDGPVLPAVRAYDAPLNDEKTKFPDEASTDIVKYGYDLDRKVTLEIENIDLDGATKATLNLNMMNITPGRALHYRLNGGEEKTFDCPDYGNSGVNSGFLLRTFSIEVPVEDLVQGTNTVEFSVPDYTPWDMVGNIDISLVVP